MTDQERKVIEMALLALEYHTMQTRPIHHTDIAIEALRQALAQPEQEPVAWHSHNPDYPIQDGDWVEVIFTSGQPDDVKKWTPLYTAPQKPDVTLISEGKTWQGLTDDELDLIYKQHHNEYGQGVTGQYERAIEAKLKEKNT